MEKKSVLLEETETKPVPVQKPDEAIYNGRILSRLLNAKINHEQLQKPMDAF